ncbi:MAG: ATP/GTP-binding protein [Bacteroidota bacterium]
MKQITFITFLFTLTLLAACNGEQATDTATETTETSKETLKTMLELVWESDTLLSTCESALYDAASGLIYVSNINENPWEDDGNGFISTLDTDGNILDLKWVEGLSAPKGMGIADGKLYVSDNSSLVEIDLSEQKIINRYEIADSPNLNDVTVSAEGDVYVSGSASDAIYVLKDGQLETVIEYDFGRLNGLLHRPEGLYYASSGSSNFGILDTKTNTPKVLASEIGNGDGIILLDNGDFVVSSWKGQVFYINSSDWTPEKILDTEAQSMNAADIGYVTGKNLLIVPTFFGNKVMAYRVVRS